MYARYRFVQYATVCYYRPFFYVYKVPDGVKQGPFCVCIWSTSRGDTRSVLCMYMEYLTGRNKVRLCIIWSTWRAETRSVLCMYMEYLTGWNKVRLCVYMEYLTGLNKVRFVYVYGVPDGLKQGPFCVYIWSTWRDETRSVCVCIWSTWRAETRPFCVCMWSTWLAETKSVLYMYMEYLTGWNKIRFVYVYGVPDGEKPCFTPSGTPYTYTNGR
jgi:hypothetical protein